MRPLKIIYPWTKTKRGQGFFVPCLDPESVKTEGLKKATLLRLFDARAQPGIRNGLTGVWFYRLPLRLV
jgi:hypothetical protein